MNVNMNLGIRFLFWMSFIIILSNFNKIISLNDTERFWNSVKGHGIEKIDDHIESNKGFKINELQKSLVTNTFYNYEGFANINKLLSTLLQCGTKALIIISTILRFRIFPDNINKKLLKPSLPPTFSLFQLIIMTETLNLITNPVMGKIDVPPYRRREKLHNINMWRNEVYIKYLSELYNETTALHIMLSYNLGSKTEMVNFAKRIVRMNGSLDNVFDKCKVNDPNLNEKLRFHEYLEHSLTKEQAVERIHNIYSHEDINLINLPIEKLFEEYLDNDLFDTVSFDDYYAIQNFLTNDYMTTNLPIPSLWRIRKAMYSLALRQYDSLPSRQESLTLYCIPKSNPQGIIHHGIVTFNEFVLCHKVNFYNFTSSLKNHSSITRFYKLTVNQMRYLPVFLNIIDENFKQLVILPGTKFKVLYDDFLFVNNISRHYKTMNNVIVSRCEWLSSVANMASKYSVMDAEYNPVT